MLLFSMSVAIIATLTVNYNYFLYSLWSKCWINNMNLAQRIHYTYVELNSCCYYRLMYLHVDITYSHNFIINYYNKLVHSRVLYCIEIMFCVEPAEPVHSCCDFLFWVGSDIWEVRSEKNCLYVASLLVVAEFRVAVA